MPEQSTEAEMKIDQNQLVSFHDPLLNQKAVVTRKVNEKNYVGKFVSGEKKDMEVLVYCEEPLHDGDMFTTTAFYQGHIIAEKLTQ